MATKPPTDDDTDDTDDTGADDEPATRGEVRGWITDAVNGVVERVREVVAAAGGSETAGAGATTTDDTTDDAGDTSDHRRKSQRDVEDDIEAKVSSAISAVLPDLLDKRELDERRRRDGAPAQEHSPKRERKVTTVMWGSEKK